jgi:hypothetical protein
VKGRDLSSAFSCFGARDVSGDLVVAFNGEVSNYPDLRWERHVTRQVDAGDETWQLLNFELWHRRRVDR